MLKWQVLQCFLPKNFKSKMQQLLYIINYAINQVEGYIRRKKTLNFLLPSTVFFSFASLMFLVLARRNIYFFPRNVALNKIISCTFIFFFKKSYTLCMF